MSVHPSVSAEPPSAAAAALLYQHHAPRVFRFCLRFLRNRQDAEDAVQTTFLRAQGALERGTVPQTEEAWLVTIARNVCLSHVESSRRRGALEVGCEPSDLEEARAPEAPTLLGIEDALASMPEMQRRAILLREWKGLSYREVAAELGTTQAAVEALLFRARRSLATALDETGSTLRRRASGLAPVPLVGTLKAALTGASAAQLASGAAAFTVVAALAVGPLRSTVADPARATGSPAPTSRQQSPSNSTAMPAADPRPAQRVASASVLREEQRHHRGAPSRSAAAGGDGAAAPDSQAGSASETGAEAGASQSAADSVSTASASREGSGLPGSPLGNAPTPPDSSRTSIPGVSVPALPDVPDTQVLPGTPTGPELPGSDIPALPEVTVATPDLELASP